MRYVRLLLLASAALVTGACFQISTVLTVNTDGSGTIQQRMLFTQAALTQLRQFSAFGGGGGGSQNFDPLSEQQARDAAATLGPGVTYVSSTPINTRPPAELENAHNSLARSRVLTCGLLNSVNESSPPAITRPPPIS